MKKLDIKQKRRKGTTNKIDNMVANKKEKWIANEIDKQIANKIDRKKKIDIK